MSFSAPATSAAPSSPAAAFVSSSRPKILHCCASAPSFSSFTGASVREEEKAPLVVFIRAVAAADAAAKRVACASSRACSIFFSAFWSFASSSSAWRSACSARRWSCFSFEPFELSATTGVRTAGGRAGSGSASRLRFALVFASVAAVAASGLSRDAILALSAAASVLGATRAAAEGGARASSCSGACILSRCSKCAVVAAS